MPICDGLGVLSSAVEDVQAQELDPWKGLGTFE